MMCWCHLFIGVRLFLVLNFSENATMSFQNNNRVLSAEDPMTWLTSAQPETTHLQRRSLSTHIALSPSSASPFTFHKNGSVFFPTSEILRAAHLRLEVGRSKSLENYLSTSACNEFSYQMWPLWLHVHKIPTFTCGCSWLRWSTSAPCLLTPLHPTRPATDVWCGSAERLKIGLIFIFQLCTLFPSCSALRCCSLPLPALSTSLPCAGALCGHGPLFLQLASARRIPDDGQRWRIFCANLVTDAWQCFLWQCLWEKWRKNCRRHL